MNPYSGANFFEFFAILATRLWAFLTQQLPLRDAASDEIQLAVLSLAALGCGWIGPFVVLKRISMFAHSISHTSLLGVVGAFLFASLCWGGEWSDPTTLLLGALLSAVLTAFLTWWLSHSFRLAPDASISLVFASLFAIAVILVTLFTRHSHLSAEAVIGNPDALQGSDLSLSALVALINGGALLLFYRPLLLSSFDEPFAKAVGLAVPFWRGVLFLLTSFTCIAAFRAVGVLVVLALLVVPYLAARSFSQRLTSILLWAPLLGIGCCCVGVALSRAILTHTGLPLSTGGLIALVAGGVFGVLRGCGRRVSGVG